MLRCALHIATCNSCFLSWLDDNQGFPQSVHSKSSISLQHFLFKAFVTTAIIVQLIGDEMVRSRKVTLRFNTWIWCCNFTFTVCLHFNGREQAYCMYLYLMTIPREQRYLVQEVHKANGNTVTSEKKIKYLEFLGLVWVNLRCGDDSNTCCF